MHTSTPVDRQVSFQLSDIGEGIREVTVKEWFVKIGDTVQQFDNLCEVQSDKASVTITSRYDGKITKLWHQIDDVALVGTPLLDFEVTDDDGDNSDGDAAAETTTTVLSVADPTTTTVDKPSATATSGKVLTTPAVRRLANENSLDLRKVRATGPHGRILKGDVLDYLNGAQSPAPVAPPPAAAAQLHPTLLDKLASTPAKTPPAAPAADRVETLRGVRKIMFRTMTEALKIPHFAYSDEIDMTRLVAAREDLKAEALQRRGVKLTYMPFMIKAASNALLHFPILNSTLDVANEAIAFKAAHNISVAMATAEGLVVPNVKHCERKSIYEIAQDLNALQERALRGQLLPADFAGGTFSLSNIGVIGGTYTHPCIMSPQVAIGALGKTKVVPRFGENGEVVRAHIMNVSWAADHRVIDGVTLAGFSEVWKKYLENPNLFLLDGH